MRTHDTMRPRMRLLLTALGATLAACSPAPDESLLCGSGTRLVDGACVPRLVCGAGTHEEDGRCQPARLTCAPGTELRDGQCAAQSSRYEVRTTALRVPADGRTKIPLWLSGREPDGTPSVREVVLGLSRADGGTVVPARLDLSAQGAVSYLIPCSDPSPMGRCLGPLQVTMAAVEAPGVPIGRSAVIEVEPPSGVGSLAACTLAGQALFFDGDAQDYIHPGTDLILLAEWQAQLGRLGGETLEVTVEPHRRGQGSSWSLRFASGVPGQLLKANTVYDDARRFDTGHPVLDIGGNGNGCNRVTGRFQVHELELSGSALRRFSATFEQHCESRAQVMLRGCIRFRTY